MSRHWTNNVGVLFSTTVLARVGGALLTYLLANWLGPSAYGRWITFMIFLSYAPLFCLGAVETLVKETPRHRARSAYESLGLLEGGVLGVVAVASGIVAAIGVGVGCLRCCFTVSCNWLSPGIEFVFAIASVSFCSGYSYHRLIANERFYGAALVDGVRAGCSLVVVGALSWHLGLRGALAGLLLTEVLVCILAMGVGVRQLGRIRPRISWTQVQAIVKVGLPITFVWWTLVFQSSIDRLLLGVLANAEAVGFYGLGSSIVGALATLPIAAGRVLYPKMNREISEGVNERPAPEIVLKPCAAVLLVSINLVVGVLALLPVVYRTILPAYGAGMTAGVILVVGSFFYTMVRTGVSFLVAANHEYRLLGYVAVSGVMNVVGGIAMLRWCGGIHGVALASVLSTVVLSVLVWHDALRLVGLDRLAAFQNILWTCLPVVIVALCLLCGVMVSEPRTIGIGAWLGVLSAALVGANLAGLASPVYRNVFKAAYARIVR